MLTAAQITHGPSTLFADLIPLAAEQEYDDLTAPDSFMYELQLHRDRP